jgi:biotin carboxyl carrier protein
VYNNRRLVVVRWSLNGVQVAADYSIDFPERLGSIIRAQLEIGVGQVNVVLPVELSLVLVDPEFREYKFVNLGSEEERILRTYLGSRDSQKMKQLARGEEVRPLPAQRQQPKRSVVSAHGIGTISKFLLAAIILSAVAIAGIKLPEMLTRNDFSAFAAVAVPANAVASPERGFVAGDLVAVGQNVSEGQPLIELYRYSQLGQIIQVTSPCDCTVLSVAVRRGDEVRAGDVLILVGNPKETPNVLIEALFPHAAEIADGGDVDVLIEDFDNWLPGQVRNSEKYSRDRLHGLPENLKSDPRYQLVYIEVAHSDVNLDALAPATIRSRRPENEIL